MTTVEAYIKQLKQRIKDRNPGQNEFIQAVDTFLDAVPPLLNQHPEYVETNIVERLIEPERLIQFRVPWTDDEGNVRVNRGYRVQFNSALGPYKGGLRFHPSVNTSIIQFLGFEQSLKNSLTGLLLGGGKGGSDFDPKGKSDQEIMRFCQSFMNELHKYIGPDTDVPAGDIGVGAREIGYLYGQYKKLNGFKTGTLTGKPLGYGGSIGRKEATGYGLLYFTEALLQSRNESLKGKKIIVSGSGNVAIYAIQKAQELGATVIGCSDSDGYILDENGIDVETVKEIKEVKRGRLKAYRDVRPSSVYQEGSIWHIKEPYDIALPCATQNEIQEAEAKYMISSGVSYVCEGANMPANEEAVQLFKHHKITFAPSKAANAGGVAVSALEMSQNSQRLQWPAEDVDQKLKQIMTNIFNQIDQTAKAYDRPDDLEAGANLAGFKRLADAMISQGVV